MDCRYCQDILDDLLVAAASDAVHTETLEHLATCPSCAQEHRLAGRVLAALALPHPVRATPGLRERILNEASSLAARENNLVVNRPRGWTLVNLKRSRLAMALAASLVLGSAFLLWRGRDERSFEMPAFTLVSRAYAAERTVFLAGRIVHIVNEIVVTPVANAELVRTRWFPIMSLEATGKPRFHQLTLAGKPGEGYTVTDECWYESATGRFVRKLIVSGRPIYANSFDGEAVYWLNVSADGARQIEKRVTTTGFRAPENPEKLLGIAAGLPAHVDEKDKDLVSDAGDVRLDDGTMGRKVRVGYPGPTADFKQDAYVLFTIRKDDHTIARIEFVVAGKPLIEVRRRKTETIDQGDVAWNLAGIADVVAETAPALPAGIMPDMVISDITVERMVERASFPTYIFQSDPPWAGQRQITDVLDIVSPPNRMFAITYRADDGRHVVLIQSASYNKMLAPLAQVGKVVYTSPSGVKILSGGEEFSKWLAGILLQSSRASIKDPPSDSRTGYLLQTPDGTYPGLAINGKLTDEELHGLINSLVPAKPTE